MLEQVAFFSLESAAFLSAAMVLGREKELCAFFRSSLSTTEHSAFVSFSSIRILTPQMHNSPVSHVQDTRSAKNVEALCVEYGGPMHLFKSALSLFRRDSRRAPPPPKRRGQLTRFSLQPSDFSLDSYTAPAHAPGVTLRIPCDMDEA